MADEGDIRAIHLAAREGRAQDVARMLDEDPQLLSSRWRDDTLLRHAAREGHAGVVGVLLERGAEVNTTNVIGDTALHLAAQYGHEELVSILLGSGADVFRRGAEGWTALMCACTRSVAVVRLLLRSMGGHGLDERNLFERTALWIACDWGHVDILQALLLAGADHTIADNAGHPPQQLAGLNGHPQCVALIEWWDGELQRAYVLHKARMLHGDAATRQQAPAAPVPAYLSPRVQGGKRLPQVEVRGRGGSGGPGTRAAAKRGAEEEEEDEKELCAMVGYVVKDLAAELYTELLQGWHK